MPAYARRDIVDESEVGVYHCINRCVRRAFLCGKDAVSGRNFDHRKTWVQDGLERLAGIFAVEILDFAILSNHLHVVLRNRPDLARVAWSDEEIVRRHWQLAPPRRDEKGLPAEIEPHELAGLLADKEKIAEWRRQLSSISWFMRYLCEPIARRANREDRCRGRFFEGRFKSQRLLDDSALLLCSMYVDLNLVRAGIAETPETSVHTSAYERIAARQSNLEESCATPSQASEGQPPARDGWLCQLPDEDVSRSQGCSATHDPTSTPTRRASNRGFLPMTLDDYLRLLDWTGRQVRADKAGAIPVDLLPILERLALRAESWVESVQQFSRRFHRAVGRATNMVQHATASGKHWYQGISHSRAAFT